MAGSRVGVLPEGGERGESDMRTLLRAGTQGRARSWIAFFFFFGHKFPGAHHRLGRGDPREAGGVSRRVGAVSPQTRRGPPAGGVPSPSRTPSRPCPQCSGPRPRICGGSAAASPPGWCPLTSRISPAEKSGHVLMWPRALRRRTPLSLTERWRERPGAQGARSLGPLLPASLPLPLRPAAG